MILNLRLVAVLLFSSTMSQALTAETVQATLQSNNQHYAGHIQDGAIIAQGRLVYRSNHSGFRIWSSAFNVGSLSQNYLLQGEQDPRHQLRVRVAGEEWQADTDNDHGVVLLTEKDTVTFSIIADGDQQIVADRWTIGMKVAALSP